MKQGPVVEAGEASNIATPTQKVNRAISIVDIISRFLAVIGTSGSAVAMGTTNQTLTFFPQFILLRARYSDLPTLTFFVIANAVVSGFLFLSLPLSFFNIIRSTAKITRIILIVIDTAMLALLTAGASAAAAIVYLAHKGKASANWPSICQQLDIFCERITGSLIGSFAAIIALMLIIVMSAVALCRS